MSFYTQKELENLGFKSIGKNVLISRKASFYGIKRISIGNNTRIDDFCVLSSSGEGEISIGRNVHIAIYSSLIGQEKILIDDFANISSRVAIYSSSDDFSGNWMTNPTVPTKYTNVYSQPVIIGKHVIIGTGSTILPGVQLSECCAVGAMSLVKYSYPKLTIIGGIPSRKIGLRNESLLQLENEFNDD